MHNPSGQAKYRQHLFRISQKDVLEDFGKDASLSVSPRLCPNRALFPLFLSSNAKVERHTTPVEGREYGCSLVLGSSQVSIEAGALERVLGPQLSVLLLPSFS